MLSYVIGNSDFLFSKILFDRVKNRSETGIRMGVVYNRKNLVKEWCGIAKSHGYAGAAGISGMGIKDGKNGLYEASGRFAGRAGL